ncbi:class I lanthipeptide [Paraliomyxa miuraensis]|uniref:class I lanthipeptide n=1 Tax=Paraliomyxa miuraensis TaxID=376150 RepID=UPI002251F58D|nr:class I lanthipeptide [Paraliomyxa miuraensis]MCX4247767.1 class I lanthipeptide [Paraliomyxa miuraensis]
MDQNKKKKLTLDTQTVRRLTKDELNNVRGGLAIEDADVDAACSYSRTCADSKGGTARRCRN